jgi:hypothetical protein
MFADGDEIKNELQGDGFLKEVKSTRLPDSEELSKEALEVYKNRYAQLTPAKARSNADSILRRLLQLEKDLYEEKEEQVYKEALVVFLREKYDTGQTSLHSFSKSDEEEEYGEYQNLQRMFGAIEEVYTSGENFEDGFSKILEFIYPAMDAISVSAQQSRRKRAGTSLQNHLLNLIEQAGFSVVESRVAGNGHVYHLSTVAPEAADSKIEGTPVYISSLMTMRDRFRQSLSDSPGGFDTGELPRYITTASGNNLATTSAQQDVTQEKVREIANEGFQLVVFEEIKNERFSETEGVISYSEFFGESLPQAIGQD